MIKAKYLMNMLKQLPPRYCENNMKLLCGEMTSEFNARFEIFSRMSNHAKSELLKARDTIKKYMSILKDNIERLLKHKKRSILF